MFCACGDLFLLELLIVHFFSQWQVRGAKKEKRFVEIWPEAQKIYAFDFARCVLHIIPPASAIASLLGKWERGCQH